MRMDSSRDPSAPKSGKEILRERLGHGEVSSANLSRSFSLMGCICFQYWINSVWNKVLPPFLLMDSKEESSEGIGSKSDPYF
jgi:hypothetical protein